MNITESGFVSNVESTPTAIIIGSGFGGLAAAARLTARGYSVTVVEKMEGPGGRGFVYKQDGFTFDGGPTIITAPFLLEELWELFGESMSDHVDLRSITPFYTIRFDDGSTFDYSGDTAAMHEQIAKFNKDDIEGYNRFIKVSERIYDVGFDQLLTVSFDSLWKMIRVVPKLLFVQFQRSVHGLVAQYVKHPKLRMVFSFHPLLVGGNPFSTTAVYALIAHLERRHGVHYAMGGTGAVVTELVNLVERHGGQFRYNSGVQEITVQEGKATGVLLESGETLNADIVVSNADSANTYAKLVPKNQRTRWSMPKLNRAKYSMSLFVWYFGTDIQYPDVPHHMILLSKRYKALLKDIFNKKILADDFSLYLHRPTATDPSLAPEGGDAFYVLAPVPHLDASINWEDTAEEYRSRIAQFLSETVLPDLDEHVVSSRMLTPVDFRDRLSSHKGAAFGLQPILLQTAWFRPHNRSEDIENLYLVGAGTHPGAGIPGVVSSAKVLDTLLPDYSQAQPSS